MGTLVSTEEKPDPKPRPRKKPGGDRWRGEVKGIVALALAGFALVALATFDPALSPAEQASPVGPVGVWLGWVAFQSFGYAAFLFPLLLGAWGASAFVRPIVASGWLPLAGIAVLLVSATGLLTQASSLLASGAARPAAVGGGLVGWAVTAGLRAGVGNVGTWFVLVAALPVGMLLGTRGSYAALARVATARLAGLRGRKPARLSSP
ncbi:MAG: DNA translocase FtsK 4TM domain-containing protein, partial [Candidatus Rokuibacteriota bacterium]